MKEGIIVKNELKYTVGEVATIFGVTPEAIKKHIRELYPELLMRGYLTFLNQEQITEIKKRMQHTTKVACAITDLEMYERMQSVMMWVSDKIQVLQNENNDLNKTLHLLSHTDKTYTASELAKELGMKSAYELNEWLENKKIQYKQNGSWLLYSEYSGKGYTETKQQILPDGRVVYSRHFTQKGREFILQLYEKDK